MTFVVHKPTGGETIIDLAEIGYVEWAIFASARDLNKLAFALHEFATLAPPLKELRDQLDQHLLGTPRRTA